MRWQAQKLRYAYCTSPILNLATTQTPMQHCSIDTSGRFVYSGGHAVFFEKCVGSILLISSEKSQSGIERTGRRVWLVRHGSTDWNEQRRFCGQSDIPLSPTGREQAKWLAACLSAEPVCALYTSDLLRAQQTAAVIAEHRPQRLQPISLAAWREIDFGLWEGLTYAEIATRFPTQLGFFSDPATHAPPHGESLGQLRQRVLAALRQAMSKSTAAGPGAVVIVSHGGPLRILLSCVLGMPLARQWQLALVPGSLSALELLLPIDETADPQGTLTLLNLHGSLTASLPDPTNSEDEG